MSENNLNESEIIPAMLQEGEAIISEDLANKYKEAVEQIVKVSKNNNKNVISSGSQNRGKINREVSGITSVRNGVIGTGKVTSKPKIAPKAKPVEKEEKIAVFSTKNVTWTGVGKVYKGYNIVTQEQADKWSTRDHIRIATPEEVAKEFGF